MNPTFAPSRRWAFLVLVVLMSAGCTTGADPQQPSAVADAAPEEPDSTPPEESYDWGMLIGPDPDYDGDGLTNAEELARGTEPGYYDSDFDRMADGWEIEHGLDPLDRRDAYEDADGDDLYNLGEYQYGAPSAPEAPYGITWWNGTDPRDPDTDGDGLPDGYETQQVAASGGAWAYESIGDPLVPDNATDFDEDGLSNLFEHRLGADPRWNDTDNDGLLDGVEYATHAEDSSHGHALSDLLASDTDQDLLPDQDELAYWLARFGLTTVPEPGTRLFENLRWRMTTADSDGDGIVDGVEVKATGTDPMRSDTDGDGSSDLAEIHACYTDPTDAAVSCSSRPPVAPDADGDGLSDTFERSISLTRPDVADTDGDGIPDGREWYAWGSAWRSVDFDGGGEANNLLDPDADGDGELDGIEWLALGLPWYEFYQPSPRMNDTDEDWLLDTEESGNDLTLDPAECATWSEADFVRFAETAPDASRWTHDPSSGCVSVRGAFGVVAYGLRPPR